MKYDVVFGLEKAVWPTILLDGAGVVCHANRAALDVFGKELEGGNTALSRIWQAENEISLQTFLANIAQASVPGSPVKLRGQDNVSRAYQVCVCPVESDGKNYALLQLMSAPSKMGEAVVDAGLAHKQKLDCAMQLARSIALDFNNALTSVLGHTSHVLSQMQTGNAWRPSLLEVEKATFRAAELANDLATFSRAEKETKNQLAGNLNALLERNAASFQAAQLDKQVEWDLRLERRLYGAKIDEAKMQQAFSKILQNAIEALGPQGRISIVTRNLDLKQPTQDRNAQLAAGSYVCVEITDSGCGIEPDVLPRIFEPFFSTKQSGRHRGLGLVFVYGIVTNNGGGVAVSSQVGIGTSVRVYLPAEKKFVASAVSTDDLTGTETILMVDDEDVLLNMGQIILSSYGYKVFTANSGQKALDLLSKPGTEIDLVITDLVMPGMSGRELVEHVHRIAPSMRILCSSGVRPANRERDEITYLQKPFTSQALLLKVKHALASKEPTPVD